MYLRGKKISSNIHTFMSPITDKYVASQLVQQMTITITLPIDFIGTNLTYHGCEYLYMV